MPPPSQQVFPVVLRNEKSFYFKQNFYVYSHPWDIFPSKNFSDRTIRFGFKIRQREGAGGGGNPRRPMDFFYTYFSNHEDDIQS